MGGFHPDIEDAEVESLLNQLEEESLLELKVNSHNTSAKAATNGGEASGGLESDLLARYTNLKSRPVGAGKKSGGGEVHAKKVEGASSLKEEDEKGRGDEEISELEMRLNALKAHGTSPSLSSSKLQSGSPFSSPSPKPGSKSKSFSPMRLVKQMSMGKKKNKSASKAEPEDSISDVDKLLAAAADELKLAKKDRTGKTEVEGDSEGEEDYDEDDEDELKDLNVKKLKKELKAASLEEDRLSREAQQVIQWAKDAARLESGASAGAQDSDVEELLRLEEEGVDSSLQKKKKGKKWSFF